MKTRLDLKELGGRFATLDRHLVSVIKSRMALAERVAAHKISTREKIVRLGIEEARLIAFQDAARELGMNPHFATALAYTIIGESCKLQIELYQEAEKSTAVFAEPDDENGLRQFYRQNLLELAEHAAQTYDEQYDRAYYATHAYLKYESNMMQQGLSGIPHRGTALDLGCATGRIALSLASEFDRAVGYDISPHMLSVARSKAAQGDVRNVSFEEVDLEQELPLPDASISCVIMNLGTGSDVHNIATLLKEVRRVLEREGRFLFSFYNREALIYAWDFLPWPVGLAAEINVPLNCLEVHRKDKIFSIHARPYTVDEVTEMFPKGLSPTEISTYPTVSPVLPHELLSGNDNAQAVVAAMDRELTLSNRGAYIVVTGIRT